MEHYTARTNYGEATEGCAASFLHQIILEREGGPPLPRMIMAVAAVMITSIEIVLQRHIQKSTGI